MPLGLHQRLQSSLLKVFAIKLCQNGHSNQLEFNVSTGFSNVRAVHLVNSWESMREPEVSSIASQNNKSQTSGPITMLLNCTWSHYSGGFTLRWFHYISLADLEIFILMNTRLGCSERSFCLWLLSGVD